LRQSHHRKEYNGRGTLLILRVRRAAVDPTKAAFLHARNARVEWFEWRSEAVVRWCGRLARRGPFRLSRARRSSWPQKRHCSRYQSVMHPTSNIHRNDVPKSLLTYACTCTTRTFSLQALTQLPSSMSAVGSGVNANASYVAAGPGPQKQPAKAALHIFRKSSRARIRLAQLPS